MANVDSRDARRGGSCSCDVDDCAGCSTGSLYGRDRALELAGASPSYRRDQTASEPIETLGCRRALEDLIGLSYPDRARELSERLVARFGTFAGTLSARPSDRIALLNDSADVEQIFRCFRRAINQVLRARVARRPVLSTDREVLDYLRVRMAFEPIEQLRVLFLNAANELIADEVLGVGTVSSVYVYPREVLKRCLELGATAMLLVHNHPSGNPAPSKADRRLTEEIARAARCLNIVLHDHLVVARDGCTSFRAVGYL